MNESVEKKSLSRDDKRGLFWDGGHYAADRAKPKYKAEARARVTRGQGFGGLKGAAAGGLAAAAGGAAVAGPPGAAVGGYIGAVGGAVAGSAHGGKKAFKRLKAEKKISKNLGVSAFGIEH